MCLWTCNSSEKKVEEVVEEEVSPYLFKDAISKLKYTDYTLDSDAQADIDSWDKYAELIFVISKLKTGDMSYFLGDAKTIEVLMREILSNIPDAVNSPSIQARFVTLETKMLKLQSVLSMRNIPEEEQLQNIKETLIAYSNLNLQINKKYEKDSQNIQKP
ncbi:conserved hypothetical protein [Formosa agariphila KMM 3901]|uniref:Uncharacterized protein n=1 Tax=Formosa agariphila (strain DSM 15362 / KCTC 12365 / LMG 23005 / KMM 3901 / M-2Alg 35-1) TaxID=1347342 RepID=T2KHF3_FORAG|nr:conserved hypothetical protein [Formosa agariphila KMM 3901]